MELENERIANNVGNKPSRASRMLNRFSRLLTPTPPPLSKKPKIDRAGKKIQGNSSGEQVKINAAEDIIQNNSSDQNTAQQNSLPYEATTPLVQASQGEQEKQELLKEHEKTNALAYQQPASRGEMITNDYRNTVPSNEAKQHEMEEIKKTRNKILLTRWKYFAIGLILLGIILLTLFSPPVLVLLPFVISLSFPVEVAIVISGLASLIAGVGIFFKRVLGKSWFPTIAMMVFTLSLAFLIPAFVPALKGLLLFANLANYAMEYLAGAIISFGAYAVNALSKRWILNAADVKKADIKITDWVNVRYRFESGKNNVDESSELTNIQKVNVDNEKSDCIEDEWRSLEGKMLLSFLKIKVDEQRLKKEPVDLPEVNGKGNSKKDSNIYVLELEITDQSNNKQIKKYEFDKSHAIILSGMWSDSTHTYLLYSPPVIKHKNTPIIPITLAPTGAAVQTGALNVSTTDSANESANPSTTGSLISVMKPAFSTENSSTPVQGLSAFSTTSSPILQRGHTDNSSAGGTFWASPSPTVEADSTSSSNLATEEQTVTAPKSLPQIPTPTLMPTN